MIRIFILISSKDAWEKEALLQQLADAGVEESIEWWQNAWETSKSSIDKLESK